MAVEFVSGSSRYINCGSDVSIDNLSTLTIALHLRRSASAWQGLVAKESAGTGNSWSFQARPDDKVEFCWRWVTVNGFWSMNQALTNNINQHLAVSYDCGSVLNDPVFYLNGLLEANTEDSTPAGAEPDDSAIDLMIGALRAGGGFYFDGLMNDVRVFNRILSAEEVSLLAAGYCGPLGGEALWLDMERAHLIRHWDGSTLVVNTNYLPDGSVNSNRGNPTNNPVARASSFPRMGEFLLPWGSYLDEILLGNPWNVYAQQ